MMRQVTITIDSHTVHENSWGEDSSPVVLLIHGIGMSHRYFMPLAEKLSRHYRVIALDLPGYGQTPDPDNVLGVDGLAKIINRYISDRSLSDVHIVGHSMGTQVALEAARQQPHHYLSCTLLAPTINKKERSVPLQIWRLAQDSLREPMALNRIVLSDYWRMGPLRYFRTSRSMMNDAIESPITQTPLPLHIVTSDRDVISPPSWGEILAKRNDLAHVSVLSDAPHNFQFTNPQQTVDLCANFFESLS